MSRRTGVVDFLSDIADDIKDFVDDEVLDRGRRTERDLRRAGRNATDWDDHPGRRDELREIRAAIRALAQQIQELARAADTDDRADTAPADATSSQLNEPEGAAEVSDTAGSGATDIADAAADGVQDVSDAVAGGAQDASDAVADGARKASDTVVNGARRATATATETADEVSEAAADGADDVSDAAASVVAEAEETVRRAHAEAGGAEPGPTEDELPINGYAQLTAAEIVERLRAVSQEGLELIGRYEQAHQHRSTVLTRVESLRGEAPWPGYDEQTVVEVRRALVGADDERRRTVRAYETRHKNRQGVLDITAD